VVCGRRELVVLEVKIVCMSLLFKLRKWVVVSYYFVAVIMWWLADIEFIGMTGLVKVGRYWSTWCLSMS